MERLKSHQDFTAVLRKRTKVSSKDIVVHFVFRPRDCEENEMGGLVSSKGTKRLGLAVTKSVGNAVKRNTVKRRFRVLARTYEQLIPQECGVDIIMRAKPGTYAVDFADLDHQVEKLFTKISEIYHKNEQAHRAPHEQ